MPKTSEELRQMHCEAEYFQFLQIGYDSPGSYYWSNKELADMAQHLGAQVVVELLDQPDPCNGVCCLECNIGGCPSARY